METIYIKKGNKVLAHINNVVSIDRKFAINEPWRPLITHLTSRDWDGVTHNIGYTREWDNEGLHVEWANVPVTTIPCK